MITGASGYLGQEVTHAFARAGAQLALLGHRAEKVHSVLADLADSPGTWIAPSTDLLDPSAVSRAVSLALERFGRLDVLVNTVGGYRAGTPVAKTPPETWDAMMAMNARSAFLISRAVVPAMIAQRRGRIIHIGSRASLKGSANTAAYAASKAALLRLTEALAAEVATQGITVNAVLPGVLDTPANRAAMPQAKHDRWPPPPRSLRWCCSWPQTLPMSSTGRRSQPTEAPRDPLRVV